MPKTRPINPKIPIKIAKKIREISQYLYLVAVASEIPKTRSISEKYLQKSKKYL